MVDSIRSNVMAVVGQGTGHAPLRKACEQFEAIFTHYLLKAARQSAPQGTLFGQTHENRVYQSLLDQCLSEEMADHKGMGIGQMLYGQLRGAVPSEER